MSVAEVAEAFESPLHDQLPIQIDKVNLAVYSMTAERILLDLA